MCAFCAAVPVAAATGVSLDNKQRKKLKNQGRPSKRLRIFPLLTALVVFLLMIGSIIVHTRFYWIGL